MGVHVTEYFENSPAFDYKDVLGLRIVATANSREIITYDISTSSYAWYIVTDPTYVTSDDESKWISFPYPVRFYGGRRSAEYSGVYVCSNGFITFDSNPTDPYYSESDGVHAELVPEQQIELAFTLPENSEDTRTTIIYVKGHYYML